MGPGALILHPLLNNTQGEIIMKKMYRGVVIGLLLGVMMIGSGSIFAQEGDSDGGDGGVIVPFDDAAASDMASEDSEDEVAAIGIYKPRFKF
jgi:hypothetical protein